MKGLPGLALVIAVSLVVCLSLFSGSVFSADTYDGITWTSNTETIEIETANATILLSKMSPALMVRHADEEGVHGEGVVLSSILGYNATADGGIVLDEVPYHAPLNQSVWSVEGPVRGTNPDGTDAVTVTLSATVDMHRRLVISGGGNPEPSTSGSETISAWADITVRYTVSATDTYSSVEWVDGSPQYPINGSSEVKFDVSIAPTVDIFADRLALDIGLMKMDYGVFGPSLTSGPYYFRGYEHDGVCVCDPAVNETDGTELVMHTFQHRSEFKQMFAFVETDENETGFFGWASQAIQSWSEVEDCLEEVTTFYRTDGTALRVYVVTPLNESTTMVVHDPSLGLLNGVPGDGVVDYPDDGVGGLIGLSVMSVAVGVVAGLAVAGGVGVYLVRKSGDGGEDPADVVSLESNRYYRHRKR